MKIELDTTKKTIKVEEKVNLNELLKTIKKLLPNNEWKDFSLETNTIINWSNPIVIDRYNNWWDYPHYTSVKNINIEGYDIYKTGVTINNGTYCIETN